MCVCLSEEDGVMYNVKNVNTSKEEGKMQFNMVVLLHTLNLHRLHSVCTCRLQSIAASQCMYI